MVNHEGVVGISVRKYLADEAVRTFNLPAEAVVAFYIGVFVGFVDGTQSTQDISGDDLGVGGGVPYVWFYATGMLMFMCLVRSSSAVSFRMMVGMAIVVDKFDSLGCVEELQVWGIVRQTVYPTLFKAYIADAEIGFAWARSTSCCGEGSYVSGLVPLGTMLTTVKRSPAMASVKYRKGSMVTVMTGLLSLLF